MKSTEMSYYEIFGDILGEEGVTTEKKNVMFFSQSDVNISFNMNLKFLKLERMNIQILYKVLFLKIQFSCTKIFSEQT